MTGPWSSVQLLVAVGGLLLLGATTAAAAAAVSVSHAQNPSHRSEALATELRLRLEHATNRSDQLDLVFLIDASASVGEANFRGELNFVRKLLSDFTMGPEATRASIVTFAGKGQLVRHIDHVSREASYADKCRLLNAQLDHLGYSGGGTYTYGALVEAFSILKSSQRGKAAEKLVFLVTDGFSNGGDPRRAANLLKGLGATIFSFGIRTGNVQELRDIATEPSRSYGYFLSSFAEFEALARRALHRDLRVGAYAMVGERSECEILCRGDAATSSDRADSTCCDPMASCGCGISSGHYACICPLGYFGSGLVGSCQPCPNGTYGRPSGSGDLSVSCVPCPDANHVTLKAPAVSLNDCVCASGFFADERGNCEAVTCPKLKAPDNGYFVKANDCNNVVNAACGIRCRIGFQLIGDSIRLCSEDGNWSGVETQCLLKTCAALRAPVNGRIRCEYEFASNRNIASDRDVAHPIDTRCQFQCDHGFQLRGSKVRNCLPLARWDGLKTTCKPIHCEPLKPVVNAEIEPKSCAGPRKLPYASNCTITCKKGYKLEGPRTRVCVGRHGAWSKRHSVNRCIDKTRPVLVCPNNLTLLTLPGEDYTYADWPLPNATDNSAVECTVWSKPHLTLPWKVHIGKHTVKYIAQDISGNRAKCSFDVIVIDKEPPTVEHCHDDRIPKDQLGSTWNDSSSWAEPVFHDNSRFPVNVTRITEPRDEPSFVVYTVVDKYGNSAKCLVNLTTKQTCDDIAVPEPLNGYAECKNTVDGGKECVLFCEDGYDFAFEESLDNRKQTPAHVLTCDAKSPSWNAFVPDCSRKNVPSSVLQEGRVILKGDSVDCDDTLLLRNLAKGINDSYYLNFMNICGNEVTCKVTYEMNCNKLSARLPRSADQDVYVGNGSHNANGSRRERSIDKIGPRRDQMEFQFRFIAKIIDDSANNSRIGVTKLRESIGSMSTSGQLRLDEETNRQVGRLALNLHTAMKDPREICEAGSVMRKHDCVKCPAGTFHNRTCGHCQSCPLGQFQSSIGAVACEECPAHHSTRRLHTKSIAECIAACEPGHYSRKRQQRTDLGRALAPCVSCEIGFYQPQYGQSQCLPCPGNSITETRAATAVSDCLPPNRSHPRIDFCSQQPCANGASCNNQLDGFSCECRDHYVGSTCEIFVDPCSSSPCTDAGQCTPRVDSSGNWTYGCSCKPGYTGTICETLVDECSCSPCRNGASCSATDLDVSCICRDGFEGDFCDVATNPYEPSPCEMNSTYRVVDGVWKCLCKPGYLGLRCNLLPCDWLPCPPNNVCVNVFQENANRSSYRCECPRGYTGKDCLSRVDHCDSRPCQNNGTCIDRLSDYECQCHAPFTGSTCEIELQSNYIMHFTKSGTRDYVSLPGPSHNLEEVTVCFWMQSFDSFNYGTVFSYATVNQDNALSLTDYNGFVLYVNGERVITGVRANDGYWHFVCVVWENKLGSWQLYLDGVQKDSGTWLAKGTQIQAKGTFVFGQEQDEVGGGFSESESFLGKLYLLDVWSRAQGPEVIHDLSNTCKDYRGSLVAWSQLQEGVRGDVRLTNSSFCQRCPAPVAAFRGFVNVSDDGLKATHSCEIGYEFRKGYERIKTIEKICMKHGDWAGPRVPNCVRVVCPFPGHFLRGQIQGRSYMHNDKIFYNCNAGYRLKGNVQRVCTAEGKWSGGAPFCVGATCKNLLAPDHGDFDYVVAEHDRDDLSILQVGQQLEFKCDAGYFLSGHNVLRCIQNGTWNFERPRCLPIRCSSPKRMNDSLLVADHSNNRPTNESLYFYGDVLAFSCKQGYKFQADGLSAEFRLRCADNGAWAGSVPNCVPIRCPPPTPVDNAIAYLLNEDREEIIRNWNDEIAVPEPRGVVNNATAQSGSRTATKVNVSYTLGKQIRISCRKGFELVQGSAVRRCVENETWTNEDVRCEPSQCPTTELTNHPMLKLFLNNTLNSVQGFDVTAKNVEATKNIREEFNFFIEGFNYGHKIVVQCKDHTGYNSNNTRFKLVWECDETKNWTLSNGHLNENNIATYILQEEINVCSFERCSQLNPPLHGSIEYVNNSDNGFEAGVVFNCNSGYKLVGAHKSYCLFNKTWTSIPKCQPVTCGGPPNVLHAQVTSASVKIGQSTFGSTVSYQCTTGYRIIGQLQSQCLASGTWSKINGRCARISCGRPQLTAGASIQGNSYLYQDRLIYVCPDGRFRDFIMCNRDGTWSHLPKCTN